MRHQRVGEAESVRVVGSINVAAIRVGDNLDCFTHGLQTLKLLQGVFRLFAELLIRIIHS